jgi:hypothetical protein
MALFAANLHAQTANHPCVQLALCEPKVACHPSRFPSHLWDVATERVVTMISTVDSTDLQNHDFLVKDLQGTVAAREHLRETQEIRTGLPVVIETIARGLGGLTSILVILVMNLAVQLDVSLCHPSRCLAVNHHGMTPVPQPSGNLWVRSRCQALMAREKSHAAHPSVNLSAHSKCLEQTTVTEAWAHPPMLDSLKSLRAPHLVNSTTHELRLTRILANESRAPVLTLSSILLVLL